MNEIFNRGLDELKKKLIDTTRRNNLINYRKPSKTRNLKIIDESAEFIFRHLVADEKEFKFKEIPEPDIDSADIEALIKEKQEINNEILSGILPEEIKKERLRLLNKIEIELKELQQKALYTAEERAKELGFDISSELPDIDLTQDDIEAKHVDDYLQTLHYPNEMEKILTKIESDARSIIEETGSNMLYIILGVLKWHESKNSDIENKSPLITIPVTLSKTKTGNRYIFKLEASGESLETNRSLAEKLLSDFNIILPELTEEIEFKEYIQQIQDIIKNKHGWSIKQEIGLSFLHFGKILMYQDLKEENWNGGLSENLILQDILLGRDSGGELEYASEYDIDSHPITDDLPLVMNADSSQHSAIIDAIEGKSIVIEGPPGTGKSQTITNMIAAFLSKGKSVLFVSEKLAALEVVHKRLESVGFADFCLELHSNKSKKTNVLDSIEKRMQKDSIDYQYDIRKLANTIGEIEEKKILLKEYIDALHKNYGAIEKSIYDIFWLGELNSKGSKYLKFDVPNAKNYTHQKHNQLLGYLEEFKQFHLNYDHNKFFWRGLDFYNLTFVDIDSVISTFKGLGDLYHEVEFLWDGLEYNDINDISIFLREFDPIGIDLSLIGKIGKHRSEFETFIDSYKEIVASFDVLKESLDSLNLFIEINKSIIDQISKLETIISNLYLEYNAPKKYDVEYIETLLKSIRTLESITEDEYLSITERFGTYDTEQLVLDGLKQHTDLLVSRSIASSTINVDRIDGLSLADIVRIEKTVESKKRSFFNFLSNDYRKALDDFRSLVVTLPDEKNRWTELFNVIKNYMGKRDDYNNSTIYSIEFGKLFKGTETDWEKIKKLNNWANGLRSNVSSTELVSSILSKDSRKYSGLTSVKNNLSIVFNELKREIDKLDSLYGKKFTQSLFRSKDEINMLDLKNALDLHSDSIKAIVNAIYEEFNIVSDDSFSMDCLVGIKEANLGRISDTVEKSDLSYSDFKSKYEKAEKAIKKYQSILSDINNRLGLELTNDVDSIKTMKKTLNAFMTIENSKLNEWIKSRILADFNEIETLKEVNSLGDIIATLEDSLSAYGDINLRNFYSTSGSNSTLVKNCAMQAKAAESQRDSLSIWIDFRKISHTISELGLEKLVEKVEQGIIPIQIVDKVFNYNFYNTIIKDILRENPVLTNFNRLSHEQAIKKYRELDKLLIKMHREEAAYQASKRMVPIGKSGARVGDLTEKNLIIKEISKQKRHIPIRQLIKRAPLALQGLKPCFMMSPLSVSQYLPPNALEFDVLIVDEASQLRPEEALGCIARAKQVIVVGDPKQLPPTSFFDSMNNTDDDDVSIAAESESILDLCLNLYKPTRQLRWHYRSQHESLIAFSNKQFYDNNLLVFPSPTGTNDELGIRHHFVDGLYVNRKNKLEAKVIIEHLELQMKKYPDRSIGIGTFNSDQRDMIMDMLFEKRKSSQVVAKYIAEWDKTSEPFFVKNLENIQGDERDIIFISTTYGKHEQGIDRPHQRFGPINSEVGWRRLNVMFTRAKQKMEIFTSLKSSDIIVSETSSRGVRALKAFLSYIETTKLTTEPEITGKGFDSPFEESVYSVLQDIGYKSVPQVGVAGYYIDLSVVSEKNPSDFVLAIECDGATYHSSKSARDRDRIKQEVLENLGWTVYRIWSVDWYKNRENEISKLIAAVKAAQDDYKGRDEVIQSQTIKVEEIQTIREDIDAEVEKEIELQTHDEKTLESPKYTQSYLSNNKVKEMLIQLRETKIAAEFEIDKRCILSDMLIELFVEHKPIDMDEFRAAIPLRYRNPNVINLDQMKFMPDIFEILELADE